MPLELRAQLFPWCIGECVWVKAMSMNFPFCPFYWIWICVGHFSDQLYHLFPMQRKANRKKKTLIRSYEEIKFLEKIFHLVFAFFSLQKLNGTRITQTTNGIDNRMPYKYNDNGMHIAQAETSKSKSIYENSCQEFWNIFLCFFSVTVKNVNCFENEQKPKLNNNWTTMMVKNLQVEDVDFLSRIPKPKRNE